MKNKVLILLLTLLISVSIAYAEKTYDIWTGFQAGELSPLLDGQVGLDEYKFGAHQMTNFFPHVQGPVSNRPGFRFIAETRTTTEEVITLANSLKTIMNAHAVDNGGAGEHGTAADATNFPLTSPDATSLATAYTLIGEMLVDYDAHNDDAKLGAGWAFHNAQVDDHSVDSTTTPTTETEAVEVITDLLAKYTSHEASSVSHTTGGQHPEVLPSPSDVTRSARLVPFEFSTEQSYMLEFGDHYIRFFMNDGQIQTVDSFTKLLLSMNGINGSTTFTDDSPTTPHTPVIHGNIQLDTSEKKFGSASGLLDGFGDYLTIADAADFDFSGGVWTIDCWIYLNSLSTINAIFAQVSNGTNYIIAWVATDGTVNFKYLIATEKVSLTSSSSLNLNQWYHIAVVENGDDYYIFIDGEEKATTSDVDRPSNYINPIRIGIDQGSIPAAVYFNGWIDEYRISNGVARWVADFTPNTSEYLVNGSDPYGISTTYTEEELLKLQYVQSADTMFIVHENHKPATLVRTGHTSWTLADESFTSEPASWGVGSYPSSVAFFENRLWYAYLQTLFGSKTGDYDDFTTGSNPADAMEYTIASSNVNEIQWLASGKILVAGTSGGEYKVSASSIDEAITPTNVRIVRQSAYGSDPVLPLTIRDTTLYLQRAGRKVREFTYSFENDIYVSPDLTLLAEHITESEIKYMAYQANPDSIVWSVLNNGNLLGLTYSRDEGIVAWHEHTTDGDFESVAVIPDTAGSDTDETWVIVKRDIDGSTVRYIEQLQPRFDHNDSIEDAFFVDSGLSYDGVSTATVSGLDHLEGETVSVLADGVILGDEVVSSGSITIDSAALKIHAGLPYTSTLQTMRYWGAPGRTKRINKAVFRLQNAKQFKYGQTPTDKFYEHTFDSLFTGDFEHDIPRGFNKEGYVSVVNEEPVPITVIAIMPEVNIP